MTADRQDSRPTRPAADDNVASAEAFCARQEAEVVSREIRAIARAGMDVDEQRVAEVMAEAVTEWGWDAARTRQAAKDHPAIAHHLIRAADIMDQPVSPGLDPDGIKDVNG